tara:strand:+ start:1291 stop:2034 length:744 start_codon:yes stop_codon:yes gene_type:complete
MKKGIGKMNKIISVFIFLVSFGIAQAQDNEIYVDQSGATANIDFEQLGTGNLITGLTGVSGTLTPLDLDGATMTLDINMIGDTNKFLGDMWADTFIGNYNFTGSTNTFTLKIDPTNTYGADSSNQNVQVTGSSNTFVLNQGVAALADSLDLDWLVQGSNNTITANIDIDNATNFMDIDGSDNTVTYDGDGVTASAGGYLYLDHTGGSRTFNIEQQSTLNNDWVRINSIGSSGTVCVIQNDQGTAVSC